MVLASAETSVKYRWANSSRLARICGRIFFSGPDKTSLPDGKTIAVAVSNRLVFPSKTQLFRNALNGSAISSFGCTGIFRRCSASKDPVGLIQWKADNETGASSWLSPYVAAVGANSLTGEREPKSQPVLLP